MANAAVPCQETRIALLVENLADSVSVRLEDGFLLAENGLFLRFEVELNHEEKLGAPSPNVVGVDLVVGHALLPERERPDQE